MASVTTTYQETADFAAYLAAREVTELERLEALLAASDRVLEAAEEWNLATHGRKPRTPTVELRALAMAIARLAIEIDLEPEPSANLVDCVLALQEPVLRGLARERGLYRPDEGEEGGKDA